jgi:cyclophilin family peptidyl-prolyl cis-trans isomerase
MRESPVLDNKHSVFGHVISGMEIVNEIQQGDIMKTIEIIRIGKKAKAFNPMKVFLDNGFDHMVITNGR